MFEMPSSESPKKPENQEGRKTLLELEATNKFVFHGSPNSDIHELEPRQPFTYPSGRQKIKDGNPCVAATRFADAAIFRALVTKDTTSFGQDDEGRLHLRATKKALEQVAPIAYVYVLDRRTFVPRNDDDQDMEWRTEERTSPWKVVVVTKDDLPDYIEEIEPE